MSTDLPIPHDLNRLIEYNPSTGLFTWKKRTALDCTPRDGRASEAIAASFNNQFAGKPAITGKTSHGYIAGRINGFRVYAHRLAWALHNGKWPDGEVDHINGSTTDNRIENLRDVSRSSNLRNARLPSSNTSGHIGVNRSPNNKKWCANIMVNRKKIHLGTFDRIEDAIKARQDASSQNEFTHRHGAKD
jgi:hypothetical protein